jgi:alpha-L-fucosidase
MAPKEYDDYFIAQISELLTNYGRIDYLWFDGCGSEGHRYDTERIVRDIRTLQPQILLFNMWDPDTRWIGNESGVADSPNPLVRSAVDVSIRTEKKDPLKTARFLPGECDCRIRDTSWFFSDSDSDTVKSLDELMGLYYYSVGRGANLLLNVSPDRRGLLPEKDKAALLRFGAEVKKLFSDPISVKQKRSGSTLTLSFETQPVNHLVLAEALTGEDEIGAFTVKAFPHPYGAPVTVFRGATIGHKAICPFPTIRTGKLEIAFDRKKRVEARLFYLPRF